MKRDKILPTIILIAIVLIVACLIKCPVQRNVEAQEKAKSLTIQSDYLASSGPYLELYKFNESDDTLTVNRHIAVICVLDLLREYSAECYADSEAVDIELKDWYFLPDDQKFGDDVFYIHRNLTLPGFIKFLDEKYKQ